MIIISYLAIRPTAIPMRTAEPPITIMVNPFFTGEVEVMRPAVKPRMNKAMRDKVMDNGKAIGSAKKIYGASMTNPDKK